MKIGKRSLSKPRSVALFLFVVLCVIASPAQTFTSLLDFNGTNGSGPGSLVRGFNGNLYGVTWGGTVFKITTAGMTILHNFCSLPNCADGIYPEWLTRGTDGNFYGATFQGGDMNCSPGSGCGTIFKITESGIFTVLYSFPSVSTGAEPTGLLQGIDGNLYGVTTSGGANSTGTVFKLNSAGQLTTLYNFCSQPGCVDGSYPSSTLIQSPDGTLYGATQTGGAQGDGVIYKVSSDGSLTTLYSFSGRDGSNPVTLIYGLDTNLYGLTESGGLRGHCGFSFACGTIFKITTAGQLTTLYSFCTQVGCTDGEAPVALVQASDGTFYGTAGLGGFDGCGKGQYHLGCGTLFQFISGKGLTTLHTFNVRDGEDPNVLVQDTDGSFYGTTLEGGILNVFGCNSNPPGCGTVFHLANGLSPFVTFARSFGKVGQTVGILGRGLTGTAEVFFSSTPADFTVVSDTYIRATVPAGAITGFATVNTPSGTLISNVPFQVMP